MVAAGNAALESGRWADARVAFESALGQHETAEAHWGLAVASWWLGASQASVSHCTAAYARFRQEDDVPAAVECAVWLAIAYKADFANFAAANGWAGRAERLVEPLEPGPLHGWIWVARAYRMEDLDLAEDLTRRALDVARVAEDVDLELVALAQIGLIQVRRGDTESGLSLLDEAMAAALGGEGSSLSTVVYACCDMLNACEVASDAERAAQWCEVADGFVATYGCPFLYAECRIAYGSVLTAKGRWSDADRELCTGLAATADSSPGLHARALTRLADLRVRQGRLEEADRLLADLGEHVDAEAEAALSLAALFLARGDGAAAVRNLEQRLDHLEEHRSHLATALDLLVDAHVVAGDDEKATSAADRLGGLTRPAGGDRVVALASSAHGRVAASRGDTEAAVRHMDAALGVWSRLELPFEAARERVRIADALAGSRPDVAIDHAQRALTTFEELGATPDADRTAAFLRSMGAPARTGPKGIGVLTKREREVLALLGHGLSNPEIADRLHVSRKTASHHVSNILSKLQLRNRAEAAAYVAGKSAEK